MFACLCSHSLLVCHSLVRTAFRSSQLIGKRLLLAGTGTKERCITELLAVEATIAFSASSFHFSSQKVEQKSSSNCCGRGCCYWVLASSRRTHVSSQLGLLAPLCTLSLVQLRLCATTELCSVGMVQNTVTGLPHLLCLVFLPPPLTVILSIQQP